MIMIFTTTLQTPINGRHIYLLDDKGSPHKQFHGGTNFHVAATGLIWSESQVSLGDTETLMYKDFFELWL